MQIINPFNYVATQKFALSLVFILFSIFTAAQTTKNEAYGLKAGLNFAELFGADAIPESDRKVGYSFGVFANYKIKEKWFFQPELIWSLQGEKSETKGRYNISYLNVPLMVKYALNTINLETGVQVGFQTISTSKNVPDSIRLENFETFDFSLNIGVSYSFWQDWSIGVRYCHGLTNLVENRELKNSVLYFGLGYKLF